MGWSMTTPSLIQRLPAGPIQATFTPQQVTALTNWSSGIRQVVPGAFVATIPAKYDLATGWNFIKPSVVVYDEVGNWDPNLGQFACGPGELWSLTAIVHSDDETIVDGQLQACAWVDAGDALPVSSTAGFNLFEIALHQAYAGSASSGTVGGTAPFFFTERRPMKVLARLSGTVAVTVLPGQGHTYVAGIRIR